MSETSDYKFNKILFFALLILSVVVRIVFFDYETLDYLNFLKNWVEYYRMNGGFLALKSSIGNYNIPYQYFLALFSYIGVNDLYLIKILSCLFDYLLAYSGMMICRKCGVTKNNSYVCFFVILFLPTVVINSALWAQCDSTYVSLALLGIYLALDDRPVWSMVSMALSFGFKLQAVFILPVCVILLIMKKYKIWHFLIFPLTYLVLILPAVLAGRPFKDAFMLYVNQMNTVGSAANYNSPALNALTHGSGSVLAAVAAMLIIIIFAFILRKELTNRMFILLSVIMVTAIPFFLPHMHDRYFYASDVLSCVVMACFLCGSELLASVLAVCACISQQFASLICYLAYLKTYYLKLGSIYLTNDRGAVAVIISLLIYLYLLVSDLDDAAKAKKLARNYAG